MARFAAISGGVVVGLLEAAAPPSLNVPIGLSFVDITNLPQITTVGWRYDSSTGTFFEVDMATQKEQFIEALQKQANAIAAVVEQSRALVAAFTDRGYDAAASDPITNADLAAVGIIVYDLGSCINLMQQIQTLAATPNFEAALSKLRTL